MPGLHTDYWQRACPCCSSEHFATRELDPGVFSDECLECGAEPVDVDPFEFIHPVQGVNSEMNYEQDTI